ncbi:type I restriction-modification system subunit M [Fimbriiglobus ruber]|uniref:site-specific DNA-methyltransferase (adenine-specific) n=1 Tax=Fimbriiglobus ruber TaxID=1908690 RepID=A0A225DJP2_9BACT|nr:type I restriction-modification system subunit M [Fimbriiglobus ruber]OWK37399.1 Type I restriction-modification system, DNA-methyltransferase subunit M [Fimbriiglobus ruber]
MPSEISQDEINAIVWKACDTFRGAVDPSEYKNYILTMLFLKYLSDLWKDKRREYEEKYKGDAERVKRALGRERFVLPDECDFDHLYAQRDAANIGEIINIALEKIEDANKAKLENVFRNIDFNSEPALGQTRERNRRLKHLLDDFNDPRLDLRPSRIGNRDVIGDVYEYLIGQFAAGAGKKAGEFYTPPEVSTLLAKLVDPKPGDRICDPACGSGSLLIRVAKEVHDEKGNPSKNFSLFGQESNGSTWALCRMNMFLHEQDGARVEWCDTITNPKLIEDDQLMKFNVVVANPPFSLDKWGADTAAADKFERFFRGIPPKSKGDYAFITHMIEIALADEGRVGVIVPHGVLFRGGSEGLIRQKLIEENFLEAVIGLPANLFFGTGIPAAILIFKKGKKTTDVLFIDASREYADEKKQTRLRPEDIAKIVATYQKFKSVPKYAHRAKRSEIEENEFNLNIPRYVDTSEPEEVIDVVKLQAEIDGLESQLAQTRAEMQKYLAELGVK